MRDRPAAIPRLARMLAEGGAALMVASSHRSTPARARCVDPYQNGSPRHAAHHGAVPPEGEPDSSSEESDDASTDRLYFDPEWRARHTAWWTYLTKSLGRSGQTPRMGSPEGGVSAGDVTRKGDHVVDEIAIDRWSNVVIAHLRARAGKTHMRLRGAIDAANADEDFDANSAPPREEDAPWPKEIAMKSKKATAQPSQRLVLRALEQGPHTVSALASLTGLSPKQSANALQAAKRAGRVEFDASLWRLVSGHAVIQFGECKSCGQQRRVDAAPEYFSRHLRCRSCAAQLPRRPKRCGVCGAKGHNWSLHREAQSPAGVKRRERAGLRRRTA